MDDVIQVEDKWYVLASSSRADDRTRVLKQGETFGLFDQHGDIQHIGIGDQGIYHEGTRFLSQFELSVNQQRPLLLNSTVKKDNTVMTIDLTTPDLYQAGECKIPKGTMHIFRSKLLWQGVHYERISLHNYADQTIDIELEFVFAADFNDIFQVRGVQREKSGEKIPLYKSKNQICLAYRGLDGLHRQTRINFNIQPILDIPQQARFPISLQPHEQQEFYLSIACDVGDDEREILDYNQALQNTENAVIKIDQAAASLYTSNEQFNDWINRSAADLNMLTTFTDNGAYPYAGVPWFSTPFGRDGIITALQYLWIYPDMAKGVLAFLSATQATHHDATTDAEPGKILHETRKGEMAELGEIPFKQYYGTIDATPLFIVLAGEYYARTGDRPFIESIWTNIEHALEWIDQYGDRDNDGFVEYVRESDNGLLQQGWKDSDDSIMHQDGSLAKGPIALCEVQAYVYQAKQTVANFLVLFGEQQRANKLFEEAKQLKKNFNEQFWCEDISSFALALDGDKRPCKVKSSNAGHTLYSRIASREYASRVANTLLDTSMFSGWGIRTLANDEQRYNPMSYHNGSIWPHDNAIIAMGLARYGLHDKALQIMAGLFNASITLDLNRLPELFCGFDRLHGQGPTLYPVACAPQAWASGAVFQMLQASLGINFSAQRPHIQFIRPQLPDYLRRLQINNLKFNGNLIEFAFRRHPNDVGINILRKEGDIDVAIYL